MDRDDQNRLVIRDERGVIATRLSPIFTNEEFEAHVKSNFISNLKPFEDHILVCSVGHCHQTGQIAFAWKQNDKGQGEITVHCEAHNEQFILLGNFGPNDYFRPYAFILWLEKDGRVPQGFAESIES